MASTTGKPAAVLVLPPLLPSLGGTGTTMADGELHHSSSSRKKESPAHNDGDTPVSLSETLPNQTKNEKSKPNLQLKKTKFQNLTYN